jgi:4a-hydroxytetrahydrobiopterin dehydratase
MAQTVTLESAALAALQCRPGAPLLPQAELKRKLTALPAWKHAEKRLRKTFRFPDYYHTIAFVNALAWMANVQDHHPDLSVHYGNVVVDWSTHDAGGITLNDCICAAKTDQLAP